jgi:hypothetical protein
MRVNTLWPGRAWGRYKPHIDWTTDNSLASDLGERLRALRERALRPARLRMRRQKHDAPSPDGPVPT